MFSLGFAQVQARGEGLPGRVVTFATVGRGVLLLVPSLGQTRDTTATFTPDSGLAKWLLCQSLRPQPVPEGGEK